MIICKDCGKTVKEEECRNLKVTDAKATFGFNLDQLCEDCYQARLKDKAEKPAPIGSGRYPWGMDHDPLKHNADIREIINQAMDRDDKQISIFIRGDVVSVDVRPYKEEAPRWIKHGNFEYECSNCGDIRKYPLTYCPNCGEMIGIRVETPDGDKVVENE